METGDIIKLSEKDVRILRTHFDRKKDISGLIQRVAELERATADRFWNTVFGLYPSAKDFDIHIDWKEKELVIRGKKDEVWE